MSKLHETKKKIIDSLLVKRKTLMDLSREMNLAPSTVSQHIHELLVVGVIRHADEGLRKWKYYEVNIAMEANPYIKQEEVREKLVYAQRVRY